MERRKLVFFVNSDPGLDPGRISTAYHFATVAAKAGLDAEVRLAGDAVKVAIPEAIEDSDIGNDLREKVSPRTMPGYTMPGYIVSL